MIFLAAPPGAAPGLPTITAIEGAEDDEVQGEGVWGASIMIADMVATGAIDCAGRSVLELGCGCGIAGLAAAVWGGAANVHLTDNAEVCAPGSNLHRNVAGNGGGSPPAGVVVRTLDWNDDAGLQDPEHPDRVPQAQLVLGADVLFSWCPKGFPNLIDDDPVDVPALIENNANVAAVIERFLTADGEAWLVAKEDRGDDVGKFVLAATGLGLLVEQTTVPLETVARAAASAGRFCTELTGYIAIRVTRLPK